MVNKARAGKRITGPGRMGDISSGVAKQGLCCGLKCVTPELRCGVQAPI